MEQRGMGVFRAQWINQHCSMYALLNWRSVICQHHPRRSVASERLFSAARDIYSDQRTHLAPERAEMLLFVRENFKYIACLDHLAK